MCDCTGRQEEIVSHSQGIVHHQHGGHGFVVGRFACDDRNCTEIPRIQRIAAGSV